MKQKKNADCVRREEQFSALSLDGSLLPLLHMAHDQKSGAGRFGKLRSEAAAAAAAAEAATAAAARAL